MGFQGTRKAISKASNSNGKQKELTFVKCHVCKRLIASNEWSEHMRISHKQNAKSKITSNKKLKKNTANTKTKAKNKKKNKNKIEAIYNYKPELPFTDALRYCVPGSFESSKKR